MKVKSLGKIFDPRDYKLPNNCYEFAQSPQVVEFEHFIRVYFSTREKDKCEKYLSHIAFVDMTKNFKIIDVSKNTVIKLGKLGTFDEHGIFPMNVLKVKDQIYAYTTGWTRRVSVSVDAAIGLAISDDNGSTFKRIGDGPVLSSSLNEPFLVGDAFVQNYNNMFHMWYIHGVRWIKSKTGSSERVYKIAHASSQDGIDWIKSNKQIITDKLNIDECQALPTVIEKNGRYHMFFCYRDAQDFRSNRDKGYKIGYAYSLDLIDWIRDDELFTFKTSKGNWDDSMQCYPHAFALDNRVYLMYNGNEFGRYGFGLLEIEFD